MRYLRAVWRVVLWALACLMIVILITVGAVRLRLYVLRYRAESLLADMETITLRQTTFRDVQPMFLKWRRWTRFDGPCSQVRCKFDISLDDINSPLYSFLYEHDTWFDLAAHLGERPAEIRAEVTVLNGIVWSEGIAFGIENRTWSDGRPYIEMTSGEAISVSKSDPRMTWQWHLHPDYAIWWPGNLQNQVRLQFTPFANFADIHRLMSLNFSCLTRIVPCRDKKEIMPEALAQVAHWSSLPDDEDDPKNRCTNPLALELSARDSPNIVVATVSARRVVSEFGGKVGAPLGNARVILILRERLKTRGENRAPSKLFVLKNPQLRDLERPGSREIVFYKDDSFDAYSVTGCSLSAATPQNLSAVRRGIAEDTRPPGLPDFAFQYF